MYEIVIIQRVERGTAGRIRKGHTLRARAEGFIIGEQGI